MGNDTIVQLPWKRIIEETIPIAIFKGYWVMGALYLFMFYPDHTRVGQIEFCMN